MAFLKYIFLFISASGSHENGWFALDKAPQTEEVVTDADPSIWVYFLKKLGSEKLSIRFPSDPVYRSFKGGFIARANGGGEIFELTVLESKEAGGDRLFEMEGKWVHEHLERHGAYLYKMRTYSLLPESARHVDFVSSFSIGPA